MFKTLELALQTMLINPIVMSKLKHLRVCGGEAKKKRRKLRQNYCSMPPKKNHNVKVVWEGNVWSK